jgi:hypothetical protein
MKFSASEDIWRFWMLVKSSHLHRRIIIWVEWCQPHLTSNWLTNLLPARPGLIGLEAKDYSSTSHTNPTPPESSKRKNMKKARGLGLN